MKDHPVTRRDFVKTTLAASAAALAPSALWRGAAPPYDPKGLPTRVLGKTGVRVPLMVFGTGSRFMAVDDEDAADRLLSYALDHGLYYWDTAANYGRAGMSSEERLGRLLKDRRAEVFLSTKVQERDADEARRTVERSLKRLQTDVIDLYQVHSVQSVEDADTIVGANGVLRVLEEYRAQGVIRFIGFTGHTSAAAMKRLAETGAFDTMLIALNHYQQGRQAFEESAVPAAAAREMGVLVMKVIRPRETVEGLAPRDLIRYALSLPDVTSAVIGTDGLEVLKQNIALLERFRPMEDDEMERIRLSLAPFFKSPDLPWMQPSYRDAYLA